MARLGLTSIEAWWLVAWAMKGMVGTPRPLPSQQAFELGPNGCALFDVNDGHAKFALYLSNEDRQPAQGASGMAMTMTGWPQRTCFGRRFRKAYVLIDQPHVHRPPVAAM